MDPFLLKTASLALSFVMNGVPMQAEFLKSDGMPCELSAKQAQLWRKARHMAVEQQVGDWCTAGSVIGGRWIAVQWRRSPGDRQSTGWRVEVPLRQSAGSAPGQRATADWVLDLQDPGIDARVRFRQSAWDLDAHHHRSERSLGMKPAIAGPTSPSSLRLSVHAQGAVLLSGRHPDGGSYSMVIERGVAP